MGFSQAALLIVNRRRIFHVKLYFIQYIYRLAIAKCEKTEFLFLIVFRERALSLF